MKKIKTPKRIISALLVITLATTLSGCSLVPFYWNGMSKWQCEKYATDKLREKYNEDFKVLRFIHTGSGELDGICVPVKDESLLFDVEVGKFRDVPVNDTYAQSIVRREMLEKINNVLTKYYSNYAVEVEVIGLGTITNMTNPSEINIETYTQEKPNNASAILILIDKEEGTLGKEKWQTIVEDFTSEFYGTKALIYISYLTADEVKECIEELNRIKLASDRSTKMYQAMGKNTPRYEYRYINNEVKFRRELI